MNCLFLLKIKWYQIMYVKNLLIKSVAIFVVTMTLCACGGRRQTSSIADLQGEWKVMEVKNQALPSDSEAFLGFDAKEMQIYGNCGCNDLTGSYIIDESQRSAFTFENVGVTQKMCQDMETEMAILSALADVKGFALENARLSLTDAEGNKLMTLEKK